MATLPTLPLTPEAWTYLSHHVCRISPSCLRTGKEDWLGMCWMQFYQLCLPNTAQRNKSLERVIPWENRIRCCNTNEDFSGQFAPKSPAQSWVRNTDVQLSRVWPGVGEWKATRKKPDTTSWDGWPVKHWEKPEPCLMWLGHPAQRLDCSKLPPAHCAPHCRNKWPGANICLIALGGWNSLPFVMLLSQESEQ